MIFYLATIMDKKELLELALKHNFGHCEVGVRMMALVDEIEQLAIDAAYERFSGHVETLELENRMLRARVARLVDCAGAHHATS